MYNSPYNSPYKIVLKHWPLCLCRQTGLSLIQRISAICQLDDVLIDKHNRKYNMFESRKCSQVQEGPKVTYSNLKNLGEFAF